MELDLFKKMLKDAGFNKKTFAEYANIPHSTVNNWGSINKPNVPDWVEKFLILYIENIKCENLKQIIKDTGLIK